MPVPTDRRKVRAKAMFERALSLGGPYVAGEDIISMDALYSYKYANEVLKAPFPKGEPAIAADPIMSVAYACSVLKAPFKAGEALIAKDKFLCDHYAKLFPTK